MQTILDWLKDLESGVTPDVLTHLKGAAAYLVAHANPAQCRKLFQRLAPDYKCTNPERIQERCQEWFMRLWTRGSLLQKAREPPPPFPIPDAVAERCAHLMAWGSCTCMRQAKASCPELQEVLDCCGVSTKMLRQCMLDVVPRLGTTKALQRQQRSNCSAPH